MAIVHPPCDPFIKIAETDLYRGGKKTSFNNKKGFIYDHTKPRRGGDKIAVEKGSEYYEWETDCNRRLIFAKWEHDELMNYDDGI